MINFEQCQKVSNSVDPCNRKVCCAPSHFFLTSNEICCDCTPSDFSRFLSYQKICFVADLVFKPIKNQCSLSGRNQSIDFQSKPINWFLNSGEHWFFYGLMLYRTPCQEFHCLVSARIRSFLRPVFKHIRTNYGKKRTWKNSELGQFLWSVTVKVSSLSYPTFSIVVLWWISPWT